MSAFSEAKKDARKINAIDNRIDKLNANRQSIKDKYADVSPAAIALLDAAILDILENAKKTND